MQAHQKDFETLFAQIEERMTQDESIRCSKIQRIIGTVCEKPAKVTT